MLQRAALGHEAGAVGDEVGPLPEEGLAAVGLLRDAGASEELLPVNLAKYYCIFAPAIIKVLIVFS